jgi:hypothetical protein
MKKEMKVMLFVALTFGVVIFLLARNKYQHPGAPNV